MKKYMLIEKNHMKNKKISFAMYFLVLFLFSLTAFAQENATTKPLELPAFIIEGVEQLNVKSGMKQLPARAPTLNAKELDSLNTYDKQSPALLEADKLPEKLIRSLYPKGFVKGSYGIFNTATIDAGYQFDAVGFDVFARAGFNYSGGDVLNSDYNKFYVDVNSDYIADEKFFIFGGSRTKTGFILQSQNYNLYGYEKNTKELSHFDRNLTQFKFNVLSDGAYESFLFKVGANLNLLGIKHDENSYQYVTGNKLSNNYVRGFAEVKNYWKNFLLGGNILLDFESLGGNSINYYQLDGSASYFDDKFSILAKAGFQVANNSNNIDRGGFLLSANMEYRLDKMFTIKAEVSSGLEKNDFENFIFYNPYMSFNTEFDYTYNILKVNGNVWFHPTEKISAVGGINWRVADRIMYFTKDTLAMFKLKYANGNIFNIFAEVFWDLSNIDRLSAKLDLNTSVLSDNKNLTYLPTLQIRGSYYRKWFEAFGTNIVLGYVGDRYILDDSNEKINAYFLLNLKADYTLNKFTFELNIKNMTNSDIYIWNQYKENGFFASLGVMWQF